MAKHSAETYAFAAAEIKVAAGAKADAEAAVDPWQKSNVNY